jgi:hypothetical protein
VRTCLTPVIVVLLLVAPLRADTLHVPGDAPDVQTAVDLAADFDEIVIGPGTWVGDVDLSERFLSLRSSHGPEVTILQGTGAGSVVSVTGNRAVIEMRGLTITGGTGSLVDPGDGVPIVAGGGLVVTGRLSDAPKVTLANCIVSSNEAQDAGGGVYSSSRATVELIDCTIRDNHTDGDGGGVHLVSSGSAERIEACHIEGNTATGRGGGLFTVGRTVARDCLVRENVAGLDGGGQCVRAWEDVYTFSGMTYEDNVAGRNGGGYALYVTVGGLFGPCTYYEDCRFVGNVAGGDGGGAWVLFHGNNCFICFSQAGGVIDFRRCLIADNQAGGRGGGVFAAHDNYGSPASGTVRVMRTTLVNNTAPTAPAGWFYGEGGALINSCIIRGHATPLFGHSETTLSFTHVQGGAPGQGNSDADPLFEDAAQGDYRLRGGSPCIDSAAASDAYGQPYPQDDDTSPADRGSLAFAPWMPEGAGLPGAESTPRLQGVGLNTPLAPYRLSLDESAADTSVVLILGAELVNQPFHGGTLVPSPDRMLSGFMTDDRGGLLLGSTWPDVPSDTRVWIQAWLQDGSAPAGWSASNGLRGTAR